MKLNNCKGEGISLLFGGFLFCFVLIACIMSLIQVYNILEDSKLENYIKNGFDYEGAKYECVKTHERRYVNVSPTSN